MKLSVVVSVYNEEAVLEQFYGALCKAVEPLRCGLEVLMVNDGSSDRSRAIIERLVQADSRVCGIHFARNFGHEAAMIAGIDHATGDTIVCMDADLQNPPSCLADIVALRQQGYDIVSMVREERADGGLLKRLSSKAFYKVINSLSSDTKLLPNASDFFMVSDRVAQVLRADYRERTRFLRGIIQTVGFRATTLHYKAPQRAAGQSKYSLRKLARFALTSIASFSKAPLKLGLYSGLLFGLLSLVLIGYSVAMWIVDRPVGGYTTLIIFLSAFACIALLVIGIIGYYVGIILDEVKNRPIYVVESINREANADR